MLGKFFNFRKYFPCYSVHALFDEQKGYNEPTKTMTYPDIRCKRSSDRFESNKGEMIFQEESFESFDFLAIGTFGMELLPSDTPTPKLATPHENWTNPQTKITENDLKLINYELEKFVEAEEKKIAYDASARSSQASIITLSHATTEGLDSENQMYTMACPLQNYLFATLTDQTGKDEELQKEKTALTGHFRENNMAHNKHMKIREESEQKSRKRNVSHFMKKMVKKLNPTSRCLKVSSKDDAALSISFKKRLSKAIKIFDTKVRAKEMTDKQFGKHQKQRRKSISHEDGNKMVGQGGSKWSDKGIGKLSSNGTHPGASTINRGHWIKTDSDCKLNASVED
ncbi:Unknown protein [Striga hermonthica]|uniref:LAZY1 n=1 Tax=Striga hermonthica TaxID=68872 RepID=A0A9N7MJT5_STRHE|nr:Unknown protein [Striga hermonthica]